ncbi:exosome complex protein Rrp42 [Candidatus Woesearchaeota archaeon]|nr:exosome complex protein Rrp42 [Candidatus Woesearchaeota archaeon]
MKTEQKEHILDILDKGSRFDGRKFDEMRPVEVTYDISPNAEGSALVKIGNTEVMAGVKMSIEQPYPDTPENGNLSVNVELLPLSNPSFEPGPPSIDAIELARVIDRGIRESGCIDVKSLCIEPGKKVWTVFVDVCSINDDGNLKDAASLAAIAAIKNARFPEVVDGEVNYKKKTDKSVPLNGVPIEVTIVKLGNHFLVDPCPEEENVAEARLTLASLEDGTLCALQKGGQQPLTTEQIDKMIELSVTKAAELRSKL